MVQQTEYITTTEACSLIGVSKTVVKKLADQGVLQTWKTPGGHRRLLRSSVDEYLASFNRGPSTLDDVVPEAMDSDAMTVLIVEDDLVTVQLLVKVVESLNLKVNVVTALNGYEGLMKVGSHKPDVILADLMMPKMDGYTMLNSIRHFDDGMNATIIVITSFEEKDIDREKLPVDVVVMQKPLQVDILKSFLRYEYHLKFA
ncbi:response regulator [Thiosulfativibrio zosterae]|nr:response regulator [Thiosulfativibrio zosterae]